MYPNQDLKGLRIKWCNKAELKNELKIQMYSLWWFTHDFSSKQKIEQICGHWKKIGLLRILIFVYESNGFDGFVENPIFFLEFLDELRLVLDKKWFLWKKKSVSLPSAICHSESKFVSTTSIRTTELIWFSLWT
jgi:hypothetical protein